MSAPAPPATIAARLRHHGRPAWDEAIGHPMVRAIGEGALPHRTFRRYFEQNIPYLEEYARAVAAIAAKTPDTAALEVVGAALHQILEVELPANREFLRRLGGDPSYRPRLESTTYAYTHHLLAVAALGDCAAGITAILPCQWSYGEIGAALAKAHPADPVYADWIALFDDPEYGALVSATTALLDRLGSAPGRYEELQGVFDVSTRYEAAFWDMAYEGERTSQ